MNDDRQDSDSAQAAKPADKMISRFNYVRNVCLFLKSVQRRLHRRGVPGLLMVVLAAFAGDLCAKEAGSGKEAGAIKKVVQRLNDAVLLTGNFEQKKQLQGMTVPLQSKGEFVFWRGQGLYLLTREPFYNATTITVDRIIHWREDGTGALAEEPSGLVQREVSRTLLAFLSADLELLEDRFLTQWRFQQNRWELALAPRQELVRKHMRSVTLRGGEYIKNVSVIAANGDITEMTFNAIKPQAGPDARQCRSFFLGDATTQCARFPPVLSP